MNRGSRGRCWVVNSPPTCISSPGVWEPQSDCSLHAARDKRRGGKGMRENRTYTIITCWGKHTIHFLNQVALISSKARRWAGSRAFSVPGEVCCWGNDSRENVLSITSSMYLKQSEEKSQRGVIRSTLFASLFFLFFFFSHKMYLNPREMKIKTHFSGWRIQNVVTSFWKSFINRIWGVTRTEGQNCV